MKIPESVVDGRSDNGTVPSKRFLGGLVVLRVVAMLLVFYCHVPNTPLRDWLSRRFLVPMQAGAMAVSVFFVVSGFSMALNHRDESWTGFRKWGESFWNRLAKFYPTAFVVVSISCLLAPFGGLSDRLTPGTAFANFLLLQAWHISWNFSGVVWFLSVLVFCYACFPFLNGWMERCGVVFPMLVSVVLWFVFAFAAIECPHASDTFKTLPLVRINEFASGMVLCKALFGRREPFSGLRRFLPGAAFLVVGMLAELAVVSIQRRFGFTRTGGYMVWMPASLALVAGLSLLPCPLDKTAVGRLFGKLGAISFAFFMFHLVILRLFHAALRVVGHSRNIAFDVACFSAALLFTVVFSRFWTARVLPRLTKTFRGWNPFSSPSGHPRS